MNIKSDSLLLVDDSESDQELIRRAFETLGISNELIIIGNAIDALEYLREVSIQPMLIICDMDMPGMSGLDLKREIHNDLELRKKCIPFIFITGGESEETINNAFFEYCVQGYFPKCNNFEDTVKMLELIINYWSACRFPHNTFNLLKKNKK